MHRYSLQVAKLVRFAQGMKNTVRYYRNKHTKGLSTPTLWILALCFLGCQGAALVEKQQGVINSRNVDLSY